MIFLALRDLAVCMKTKVFFFKKKPGIFNTGFVFLRYKNTDQY